MFQKKFVRVLWVERTKYGPSLSTPLKMAMTRGIMRRGGFFIVSLRLMALLTFVSYLFAGAGFALVIHSACHHCQHAPKNDHKHDPNHRHESVQTSARPGESCPISSSGRHCDKCHSQSSASITLCPAGTLHHEQGEIVPIAKYVLSPVLGVVDESPIRTEAPITLHTPSKTPSPPPGRPPTFSFWSA